MMVNINAAIVCQRFRPKGDECLFDGTAIPHMLIIMNSNIHLLRKEREPMGPISEFRPWYLKCFLRET